MLIGISIIFGILGLIWAANQLVEGGAYLASYFKISPLVIGLTIVALGTSAPEIIVAITAALHDKTNLAIGNAIGSNIANIGLVLGITALVSPFKLQSATLRREYPLLFLIMMFSYLLMIDGYFSVIDGCLFLLGLLSLLAYLMFIAKQSSERNKLLAEYQINIIQSISIKHCVVKLVLGIVFLPLSAQALIYGAIGIAKLMGVSELVIGLTIVAIGTSLPEIAASLVGAYKGEDDIALGNILGSNMFNLLAVLALPGMINPSSINHAVLWRDIPVMFFLTGVLFFLSYHYRNQHHFERYQGGILLLIYVCYLTGIIIKA